MTISKQEYLEAKVIVDKYNTQVNKKTKRSFVAGDGVSIKENEPYFAVTFANPEMNIVASIMKVTFTKCERWFEEPYRCFSTKENAKSFIVEKGFIVKL
jgi:hypothetical protein